MGRDKNIFCYAAKAHPSQGTSEEMLISYVANSFDFWQVVGDASLYWPRFIRVQLATGKR
jgi:endo-beta-N-acetylglucosaminidase D